ncbi:MAG: transglutaminase domain-containing protein [Ignavibacteriales bacterium]|nr:transglutaminase domain-containing protein [Ignavibacteriales bacterium]
MKNTGVVFLFIAASLLAQDIPTQIQADIDRGNFTSAQQALRLLLASDILPPAQRLSFQFEIERLDRIRKDFPRTQEEVLTRLRHYYPSMTENDLVPFEANRSLEMKIIDGEKRYFSNAVPNLFRINAEAKKRKIEADEPSKDELRDFLGAYLPEVVAAADRSGKEIVRPVSMTLTYTVTVKPNAVPDGEIIRCWLPYPRETHPRQSSVKLLSISEPHPIVAPDENLQRTIYVEKSTAKDKPTVFAMKVSFTGSAEYCDVFKAGGAQRFLLPADSIALCTSERPPHIVFTPELQSLSGNIIGKEHDPLQKAKLIFSWISSHIPWASALEYSTIPNIPDYCIENRHGDCGIQSLLFITLCRYNGIPAKWQSGWMLHPPEVNLHDWAEIFLDGYGWVPVDQSFGVQKSADDRVTFFYLGGIDAYRLIVNDDFSRDLFPAKIFPRSETVDFQRGELEWRGGNLYFDSWNYHMDVEYGTAAGPISK